MDLAAEGTGWIEKKVLVRGTIENVGGGSNVDSSFRKCNSAGKKV